MPNHESATQQMTDYLTRDPAVISVALLGSGAKSPDERDQYSDVDLLIVVDDDRLYHYTDHQFWLDDLGTVFAYESHAAATHHTLRVCYDDFRRYDLVFTTPHALTTIDEWGASVVWGQRDTQLSRQPHLESQLDQTANEHHPSVMSAADFERFCHGFWWKAVTALIKIQRGDRLIGAHLALACVQDCLVVGMLLRDREGGDWNHVADRIPTLNHMQDDVAILQTLSAIGFAFDQLAPRFDAGYVGRGTQFAEWVAGAINK